MSLHLMDFFEIRNGLVSKEFRAREIVSYFLKRIEDHNDQINAVVTINENALRQADQLDLRLARGERLGPLAGVPFVIKDIFCTEGLRTTACSKMLHNFVPHYTATAVHRLISAGALVLGKSSCDEFAMGSSNETSCFGICRNPWDLSRVPGGSSGGSASAIAAGIALGSLGTDTGGSIRQPAHFCGLVGMKPTYGRVSRFGMIAYASSLDQGGPMTKRVHDSALTLETIAGFDSSDSTTSKQSVPRWSASISSDLRSTKVGILKEFFEDLDPETAETIEIAKKVLQEAGAQFVEVSLPLVKKTIPIYYIVATSEASSNLARYDGIRFGFRAQGADELNIEDFYIRNRTLGFGSEVRRRIMLGTFALSSGYYNAYYEKACRLRRLLQEQFRELFCRCEFVLAPVSPTAAFQIGQKIQDPLEMYQNDLFTTVSNLVGLPAITVPVKLNQYGLPLGVQLIGPHFEEKRLFDGGFAIEEKIQFYKSRPNGF